MQERAIETKRKVPECAIKLCETYGAGRATSKVESFFYKVRVTCQTSKISRCGNNACTRRFRVYSSFLLVSQSLHKFPFAVVLWTPVPFLTFRARSGTRIDKELSADRPWDKFPGSLRRCLRALWWTRISFYDTADFIVWQNCLGRSGLLECPMVCGMNPHKYSVCNTKETAAMSLLRWPWRNFDRHLNFDCFIYNLPCFLKIVLQILLKFYVH